MIFILILYSIYFEVPSVLILNNMHDAVDCDFPRPSIYTKHKISMIRIWTLQYSLQGCVFALFAIFVFFFLFFFVNATATTTVNFDKCFESFESFASIISIFFLIYASEWEGIWIKYVLISMSLMSTLYSYSLQSVLINQCWTEYEWIRVVEFQFCWFTHIQNFMSTYE